MQELRKIKFINNNDTKISLVVEPWAEEYSIESNSYVEIVGQGGDIYNNDFEVEFSGGVIVVHGWQGSILSVYCKNELMLPTNK